MPKPATPAQITYLRHLLRQVGGVEPDWDKFTDGDASTLIDGLKSKRGKPVWYGNGMFSHWQKDAAWSETAAKVAAKFAAETGYFQVGDVVLFGKYKNKRGKVVRFGKDKWGNPTIEVEPIPKGRKKNKIMGLYKLWRADVKEKALAEQAGGAKLAGDDHDFDDDEDDDAQ